MNDYIFFMHNDIPVESSERALEWGPYLANLKEAGAFEGGSAIGDGVCVSKSTSSPAITGHLSGYIRIRASDLAHARALVIGNPVIEAGGTVEIRELLIA
jgi:hypothetical protein